MFAPCEIIRQIEIILWLGLKGYKMLLTALRETESEAQSRRVETLCKCYSFNAHNQCIFHICKLLLQNQFELLVTALYRGILC